MQKHDAEQLITAVEKSDKAGRERGMRLIDADETIEAIEVYAHELACIFGNPEEANRALAVKNIIDDQPEVPAPVVHGRWIKGICNMYVCDQCGNAITSDIAPPAYCCDCGALMDGGEEE